MPFSDPMADGPAVQASSLRALKAGHTMQRTLDLVRAFRVQDQDTPIVLMGYYNPDLRLPARALPRRCRSRRRRRPHHRRCAARGRRRAVPARHRARAQLHPPRHADHGRQAAAGRARQHLGVPLLRVHHRHHRRGRARRERRSQPGRPHQESRPGFPSRSGSASRRPDQAKAIAAGADGVVVGSALVDAIRDSLGPKGESTGKTVPAVLDLVKSLAQALRTP